MTIADNFNMLSKVKFKLKGDALMKISARMLRRYIDCAKQFQNLHDKDARQKAINALIADNFTPQEIIAIESHVNDISQGC